MEIELMMPTVHTIEYVHHHKFVCACVHMCEVCFSTRLQRFVYVLCECLCVIVHIRVTLEFLDKKHADFGQGLEFLKFGQGNRGLSQQNQRKT